MDFSVLLPFATTKAEQVLPYASLVEWTGVHRLWQGQSMTVEPHQAFSYLAGSGTRIPLGLGVTLMPLRHPFEAAVQATSLARTTGQPLTVGYGPGGRALQEMLRGEPYRSPLTAAREYVGIVKELVAGRAVDVQGDYFTCRGALPPGPAPRVEIALGVLREKMARLAGEVADAAITWLTPASHLRETLLPAMHAGAEGRPHAPRLVAIVPMALARPGRTAAEMALASNASHLRGAHYVEMLRQAGIDVAADQAPIEGARALVDGGAFLSGDVDELLGRFKEFEDAGVDELVLNLTGVFNTFGPAKALAELKILLDAVGVL
jgi:alkanesulfonate monooxygenase SsuD/methylene tetrahydromethanopterin reductase-like flavin-dependent oxidoreductase (luciferase family)